MRSILTFLSIILFLPQLSNAQQYRFPLRSASDVGSLHEDWNPVLSRLTGPVPDEHKPSDELKQAKQKLFSQLHPGRYRPAEEKTRNVIDSPYVIFGFQGNGFNN